MNWTHIENLQVLDEIKTVSFQKPVLIFKHSTKCSISATALSRLERKWKNDSPILPYYLDLIKFREISNEIALRFGVEHESPQVLLLQNGNCSYNTSHLGIDFEEISKNIL